MARYASLSTTSPSRGWLTTPVLRLSHTIREGAHPKNANMFTWHLSHVASFMSPVASTYVYLLYGSTPTNRYARDDSPVAGSMIRMVGPAQSTSTPMPALWATREVAPIRAAYPAYRLQNRS